MGKQPKQVRVEEMDETQMRDLIPTLLHTIDLLRTELADLRRGKFGRSSEKDRYFDPTGLLPFQEIEELQAEAKKTEAEAEAITIPEHTRKKTKRRLDFPDHLPRKRIECRVPREDLPCPCCKTTRVKIGEVTSRELERIEFTFVNEVVREKVACPKCEGEILVAPGLPRVLDKCLLGANFLAQIIFERFANHMPYARLETKYAAEGLSLSRSVMCNSTIRCAELLEPIYKAVREEVLASLAHSVLQIDDSEVVQRNGPRPGERKVNIWAIRDQHAGVFYSATNSRNRDGPKDILGGRRGRLQSDGHDCFDGLDPDLITRIGCWAHVRRYFDKARKVGDTNALKVIDWIGKLFAVERLAKKQADAGKALTDADLVALRREQSKPIVDAIKAWLDQAQAEPPSLPGGPLMKGVGYALNQWPTLIRFLEDGRIREISNNGCERALRRLVIGRNNWQWFGSARGTKAAVILMTLVQSCREHGINPLFYLADALREISSIPASEVATLTPTGWRRRLRQAAEAKRSQIAIESVVRDLTFGR